MSGLTLTVQNSGLLQALQQSPDLLTKNLNLAVLRTVQEMASSARGYAPKAESTLTKSINARMVSQLEGQVAPHVDYAQMVEEGTGPGGWPSDQSVVDWIRVKGITPNDPGMDEWDLAFLFARSIALHGTPAQPFLQPAFNINKGRGERRMDQAIAQTIKEMNR